MLQRLDSAHDNFQRIKHTLEAINKNKTKQGWGCRCISNGCGNSARRSSLPAARRTSKPSNQQHNVFSSLQENQERKVSGRRQLLRHQDARKAPARRAPRKPSSRDDCTAHAAQALGPHRCQACMTRESEAQTRVHAGVSACVLSAREGLLGLLLQREFSAVLATNAVLAGVFHDFSYLFIFPRNG